MGMSDDNPDDQQVDDVDKQSEEEEVTSANDQADDDDTGVEDGDADDEEADDDDSDSDDDDDDGEVELIGKEKYDSLKNDPEKLLAELNRAATKKFQGLSAQRKALAPYAAFINQFESDSTAAVTELARQLGLQIVVPKKGGPEAAEAAAESIADKVTKHFRKVLGPEYEDLADKIAAGVQESVQLMIDEAVTPLKAGQDSLEKDSAAREAGTAIKQFERKYPEWKKHEKSMVRLSKQFPPGEGTTEAEYLEGIYHLATRNAKTGDKVQKTIKKMVNNISKSEGRNRSVSDKNVSKGPAGKLPSFREAAAAADRGERFE